MVALIKRTASTVKTAGDKAFATAGAKEFYAGLRARLKALHTAETDAVEALAAIVK